MLGLVAFAAATSFGRVATTRTDAPSWLWQDPSPQGNRVDGLSFAGDTTGWAVGASGVLLKTTDGGAHWAALNDGSPAHEWFAASFVSEQTGWIAGSGASLRKTIDGGSTFTTVTAPVPASAAIRGLSALSGSAAIAVGGTSSSPAILYTTDGESWNAAKTSAHGQLRSVAFPASGLAWAVGTDGIMLHSTDDGATWASGPVLTSRTLNAVTFAKGTAIGYVVGDANGSRSSAWRTTDGRTWSAMHLPGASGDLYAVACDPTGTHVTVSGAGGAVYRSNDGGDSWTRQSRPGLAPEAAHAVAMPSADEVVLGGELGTMVWSRDGGRTGLSERQTSLYDLTSVTRAGSTLYAVGTGGVLMRSTDGGRSWSGERIAAGRTLRGVAFADASNGVAVGDRGLVLQTADGGSTWTAQSSGTSTTLNAVEMTNAGSAVAVGDGGVITTWNGTAWSLASSRTSANLYGVAGSGTRAWAVGARGTVVTAAGDLSGAWSEQRSGTAFTLRAVSADGDDVMAVGDGGTALRSSSRGARWAATGAALGTPTQLLAVHLARTPGGALVAWAGGTGALVSRSADGGTTWSAQDAGLPAASPDAPTAVRSLWSADGSDCVLVGTTGETRATTGGGTGWIAGTYGTRADLSAVAASGQRSAWAVGAGGTIVHTFDGGETWFRQPSGSVSDLRAIAMSSATNGWTVGDGGTVRRTTDGGWTWSSQDTSVSAQLRSIDATGDVAVAVGAGGTALHTADGGATWAAASSLSTSRTLNGVALIGTSTAWAVAGAPGEASGATILKSGDGGDTWSVEQTGTAGLNAVAFRPDGATGWAVGDGGAIWATTDGGATWARRSSHTTSDLYAVSFSSDATGWASGAGGTVVKTTDGGATWTPQDSGTQTRDLRGAAMWGASEGWLVGDGGAILMGQDARIPVTTALVSPGSPDGDGGWYVTAPTVELLPDKSATTSYRFTPPGGSQLTYSSELTVPEGVTSLAFHANDGFGNVEAEQTLDFRVDTQAPSAPSALATSADATDGSVGLTWQASTDAGASGVAGYDVYVDGALFASSASPGMTLTGLPHPNTTYTVRVVARDAAGNASAPSAPLTVTTAGSATDALGTTLRISPAAPDGEDGWYVTTPTVTLEPVPGSQPSPGGVALYGFDATSSPEPTYTAPFSPAAGDHTLWYWSVATDGSESLRGVLPLSERIKVDPVTPQAPATLTATPTSDSSVHLVWPAATDDTYSGIAGYDVLMDGAVVASVPSSTLTWEAVGLAADAPHDFSVRTVSSAGATSAPTATQSARTAAYTLPTAPALVFARGTDGQTVLLDWTPSADARTPVSYVISRSSGGAFVPVATVDDPEQYGYADTGLAADTTYAYRITVVDPRGTSSPSAVASAATTAPVRVRALAASTSTATPGAVVLTWAPSDNDGVAGYYVYRSRVSLATAPGGTASPADLVTVTPSPVASPFYIDTDLTTGLDYYYSVAAVDLAGNVGIPSVEALARPIAPLPADANSPHGNATSSDRCTACHAVHGAHSGNLLFGSHEATPSSYVPAGSHSPARATWDDARNCTSCHNGSGGPDVTTALTDPLTASPAGSRHGIVTTGTAQPGSLFCGSCHRAHRTGSDNPDQLDVNGVSTGAQVCYGCHGSSSTLTGGDTTVFSGSVHNTADDSPAGITCLTCHTSETATNPRLLRYDGYELCAQCHAGSGGSGASDVVGSLDSGANADTRMPITPADQRATGGRLTCANCHSAMRTTASEPLVDPQRPYSTAWTGDTNSFCLRCHDGSLPTAAQTEPFVAAPLGKGGTTQSVDIKSAYAGNFHGGATATDGNANLRAEMGYSTGVTLACTSCHDPHGSANEFALKQNVTSADGSVVKRGLVVAPVASGGYDLRFFCASCHDLPAHATSSPFPSDCTAAGCHRHTMAPAGSGSSVTGTAF